ncbi:hypothetical protein D3C87_970100 [compost metagenome]
MGLGVGAVEETIRDFHPIDLGQNPVAVDATDVVATDPATGAGATHRNTRLVTHQILDGIDVVAVQFLTSVYGDSGWHAVHGLFLPRGADGHLLQVERAATTALFQHDAVVAHFAIAQVGPHQQALQGFLR